MKSALDRSGRSRLPCMAVEEPERRSQEARSTRRQMTQLEDLRKLRRDRVEAELKDARAAASAAFDKVSSEEAAMRRLVLRHDEQQSAVQHAVGSGSRSLDDVRMLLARSEHALAAVHAGHNFIASLQYDFDMAQQQFDDALLRGKRAAAAHEKILEWKKASR